MNYFILGTCLALAALLPLNALGSAAAALLWHFLEPRARSWAARRRAHFLFWLRVGPFVASLVFVLALLLPAYAAHEPRGTDEAIGTWLAFLAALSGLCLVLAVWRAVGVWRATRTLRREWLRAARPLAFDGVSIPCFRIPHALPLVAVVGARRPALFVAERVLASLSGAELAAVVAHESGHLLARDNLLRAVMRACRDSCLIAPFGRRIDRAWAESVEDAADEHAARAGADAALDLAAALVRIARMFPAGATISVPAGAHLAAEESGVIARRVRHLTELAGGRNEDCGRTSGRAAWAGAGALLLLCAAAASYSDVLPATHEALERIVRTLG